MCRSRLVYLAPIVAAMTIAIGLVALAGRPAAAAPDVSGSWTVSYSLACSGSLRQTGNEVTGSLECGSDILVDLGGTFDASTGTASLSGELAGILVTITGTISTDGRTIDGTWSAPPLVEDGVFSAVREGTPSTEHIAGFWLLNARNIFSSQCSVEMEQNGSQLAATLDCEDGPTGTLDGSYDLDTGAISLNGPFGDFGLLEVRVNLSDDGNSFTGIWRLVPDGPAGVMEGERVRAPEPTPPRRTSEEAVTPTPSVELPATGGGTASGGSTNWLWSAIGAALSLSAACWIGSYRLRSPRSGRRGV